MVYELVAAINLHEIMSSDDNIDGLHMCVQLLQLMDVHMMCLLISATQTNSYDIICFLFLLPLLIRIICSI